MKDISDVQELIKLAQKVRKYILDQIYAAGSGHPGGSLSCVEILTALYMYHIKPEKGWIHKRDRDHVILSKGHAVPALYATLAVAGMIPESELKTLRQFGSRLQGHPDRSRCIEVEMSTGSLGQGLSIGLGQALALHLRKSKYFSFVILGDGEINSGQIWEAIAYAGSHKSHKLVAILDSNGIQNDNFTKDIQNLTPYKEKFEAFGWVAKEINGQNMEEVVNVIEWATSDVVNNRPKFIIANTKKGAGISFIENQVDWHSHAFSDEEYNKAIKELKLI